MAGSPVEHVFADIVNMEVSDDDVLESELSMGDGLPEFDPANVLGLHADDNDAFEEEMWSVEGRDDEVEDTDPDDALHLHINEAVEAILCLNSNEVTSPLQDQLHSETTTSLPVPETPVTMKADNYTTLETPPRDNSQMTDEIDFPENDIEYDSDNSGWWSTEVNPPDDAVWCMSNVPDWEAGFSAWCSAHQGQAFHRMLLHCTIQCTMCLATFSLTSDRFSF